MYLNLLDRIGNWNPQFFREIKGRLKGFNVLLSLAISFVIQLILFLYHIGQYPNDKYPMSGNYCNLSKGYEQQLSSVSQLIEQVQQKINFYSGNKKYDIAITQQFKTELVSLQAQKEQLNDTLYKQSCPIEQLNIQIWWQDHWQYIFLTLCVVFIYTLLVAGTYLLVNNLGQEERGGTLNFIRLSPQSEASILIGKMLGVPIVIYLMIVAAIPLHLWSGFSAKIALSSIFSFYIVLAASCFFFYSATLLFGLLNPLFSGFQPWLASGVVMVFLMITMQMSSYNQDLHNTATWLRLLSPFDMTKYLFPSLMQAGSPSTVQDVQFFYLPIAKNSNTFLGIHLLNYGVGSYWIWQALKRRFRSSNATLISKTQSYLLVTCAQIVFWGFTLQYTKNYCPYNPTYQPKNCYYDLNYQISQNFSFLVFFNLVLLLGLLVILSPHRQQIQDWARYRHQEAASHNNVKNNSWWRDLIWSDHSPVIIAIAINLMMVTIPYLIWIVMAPALNINHNNSIDWVNSIGRMKALLGVLLFMCMMMIYTTIAQRMLLLKTPKRALWAIGTIGLVMFTPPIILGMLEITPQTNSFLWLFSTFPWLGIENSATTTVFMAFLAELTVLGLLNLHLTNQVKLAGESATKALLAGR
ncbi:ABC transporter permease subunit [Nostoc sp. FACHB-152]|uniref:ABC transporter permease subunit n=1 Tax=unclassified Nostoc TaxID=2593658 RepID=UPI00168906FA|nr:MULTISPECIES: ABC transporter permease subunit [unclassified Nostoc]MBD2446152.1 ABC transporter permease subunit [Nostoc sp. FACHB-152]MBD2467384.1 ABC transporter permease subunit [Nostoc sp. FACHB-145]